MRRSSTCPQIKANPHPDPKTKPNPLYLATMVTIGGLKLPVGLEVGINHVLPGL